MSFKSVSLPRRGNLLATRRGNLIIAAAAAALAGILLVAFIHSYKRSLTDKSPSRVIVADRLIPKGASADVLASSGTGLHIASVAHNRLANGVIANAAVLHGEVASRDIFPGEQITARDFTKPKDPLLAQVQGTDRVITIPLDPAHGLVGQIHPGDRVDVLSSFSGTGSAGQQTQAFTRVLARNVLVLGAPDRNPTRNGLQSNSSQTANITLRVSSAQSAMLAYASDNGKVWLVMRPITGALDSSAADRVTLGRVLSSTTPVAPSKSQVRKRP